MRYLLNFLLLSFVLFSCSDKSKENAKAPKSVAPEVHPEAFDKPSALLPHYNLDAEAVLNLPNQLIEISGLARSSNGRLFGHDDEHGVVYQIDPDKGRILERFTLGALGVEDDFEGIEIVGERFFLVNSNGVLYEFREGKDQAHVEFTQTPTGLSARNDVEGLCYDPANDALLLVCKEDPGEGFQKEDEKTVYAFSLATKSLVKQPRFVIPAKKIRQGLNLKEFKPSGIERHPVSGSFFILSSRQPAIIEISATGELLSMRRLPSVYAQPEGIAIDSTTKKLYIGSEGGVMGVVGMKW